MKLLAHPDTSKTAAIGQPRGLSKPEIIRADKYLPVIGREMQLLLSKLTFFAEQKETLLINGPTGAGKSKLALWVHHRSNRSDKPFVLANLNSIPPDMQMAELFGWEKGAFTGAITSNEGYVKQAQGGTLFLDEIDKLSLKAQSGLLEFLDTKTYKPLGTSKTLTSNDIRIIVGTNLDLHQEVEQGRFREDLFYRVHVLPIKLKKLIERKDEIIAWSLFMLERIAEEYSIPTHFNIAKDAQDELLRYPWPGNLRQLDNVMRRVFFLSANKNAPAYTNPIITREMVLDALEVEPLKNKHQTFLLSLRQIVKEFILQNSNKRFDFDVLNILKGVYIGETLLQNTPIENLFQQIGKERSVSNRNHKKEAKREILKVKKFSEVFHENFDEEEYLNRL